MDNKPKDPAKIMKKLKGKFTKAGKEMPKSFLSQSEMKAQFGKKLTRATERLGSKAGMITKGTK